MCPPCKTFIRAEAKPQTEAGYTRKPGWVYVITSVHFPGECRIGRTTNDPQRRLSTARSHLRDAKMPWCIETKNASGLEHYLHWKFAAKRLSGEWFIVSVDEVKLMATTFNDE